MDQQRSSHRPPSSERNSSRLQPPWYTHSRQPATQNDLDPRYRIPTNAEPALLSMLPPDLSRYPTPLSSHITENQEHSASDSPLQQQKANSDLINLYESSLQAHTKPPTPSPAPPIITLKKNLPTPSHTNDRATLPSQKARARPDSLSLNEKDTPSRSGAIKHKDINIIEAVSIEDGVVKAPSAPTRRHRRNNAVISPLGLQNITPTKSTFPLENKTRKEGRKRVTFASEISYAASPRNWAVEDDCASVTEEIVDIDGEEEMGSALGSLEVWDGEGKEGAAVDRGLGGS
jgi:hypothetical protein